MISNGMKIENCKLKITASPRFAVLSKLQMALLIAALIAPSFSSLLLFPQTAYAAATPVVEATNTSSEAIAVSSHSVALPAGIASGDELVVLFGALTTTFVLPTGWTELYNSGSASPGLFVIRRVADGGEGATLTVTTGSARKSNHASYRISEAAAAEISAAATGSNANPDPPSLTPSGGALNYLWLAVEGHEDAKTISAYPANYTDGFQSAGANENTIASARRALNAASEDPGTFTISGAKAWRAVTIAVPPSPPDAPTALITTSNTGSVGLSWTAPGSAGLETYGIYRDTTPTATTLLASIATTSTTYSDTSAVHGTVYYYRVTASTASATSTYSNERSSGPNSGRVIRLKGVRLR